MLSERPGTGIMSRLYALRVALAATLFCFAAVTVAAQRRQSAATYMNPVIAGDYPDPSIIRVGADYWATATSSEWGPEFPILHSRDLVNWTVAGAVFAHRPEWATGNFWAPEISDYRGRFFVYYVGHKRDGPLCVGVATANNPAGPYADRGPVVCQDDGAIDPVPVTDESGRRFLVWKEDGNSRNQPTPIWAQQLTEDGTRLIGEKKELIRNTAPWEAQLVEGPYILRQGGWFYLFYSGNACCGRECNYALGVARSRRLLGPWEKDPANPILRGNETWKCPGHGSIVRDQRGRTFLLYHAYSVRDSVFPGRQAMLDEVTWQPDGWPSINGGHGPSLQHSAPLGVAERLAMKYRFFDDFRERRLLPGWQWPQNNEPSISFSRTGHGISLAARGAMADSTLGAVIARSSTLDDYVATAAIDGASAREGARPGLGAYGDSENAIGMFLDGAKVIVYRREKNQQKTVAEEAAPRSAVVYLRMVARGGRHFSFAVSGDDRTWTEVGGDEDGDYLPPWDRAVRIVLTAGSGSAARFNWVRIVPGR